MPDATITSTASTFGTISGTFAADQSTVTGTITGVVAGTLSGSVGVPGPQGQQGIQGIQGIQGDPGAPGQGVAVGGTTGQVLQKLSATNYDTGWLTLPADFITSVTAPLAVTSGDLTVDLSAYLTTSAAASTYYLQTNPDGFITSAALTGYATETFVTTQGYITQGTADGLYYPLSGNPSGFLTSVPPPTLTNLTSDISWDGSFNIGRLLIAGVNDIGGGFTEGRLNFTSGVPNQPATGDFWFNGTDFFYQSGGVKTIASQTYVNAQGFITSSALTPYATLASPTFTGDPKAPTPATSDNDTSIATTAYVKAQAFGDRYLTTSTTSNTVSNGNKTFTIGTGLSYTPTQNITISYDASNHMHGEVLTYNSGTGVLTVDVNHHTGSGTYAAWVVNVGGVTPATSVAFADITGAVSGNTNLQAALDLKSNLASPTFTGTPTLPTGTIATTQSPGNNTTALATTAFVTAAVPAIATIAQVYASTSGTTATPPLLAPFAFNSGGYFPRMNFATTTSGTGASVGGADHRFEIIGPNVSTAGFAQIATESSQMWSAGSTFTILNFAKPVWLSFRMCNFSATYDGDAQTEIKAFIGNSLAGGIDPVSASVGIFKTGGAGSFINLMVHNGTTLTKVATTTTFNTTVIDVTIYSNNGTVNLYLNGVLAATTALGPTGTANTNKVIAAVKATATAAVRQVLEIANIKVFAPQ